MRHFFRIESFFIRSPRIWIPFIALGVVLFFPSLITFWSGSNNHFRADELAAYASNQTMNSSLTGFFFVLWMVQHFVHLIQSGFYKSLLVFGASRTSLFLYGQFQIALYILAFVLISFLGNVIAGLFFGVMPWQLLLSSDYNSLFAQILFLFAIGNIAALLAYLKPGHLVLLPLLFYWLLEGWIVSQCVNNWDLKAMEFLPLHSFRTIIGESLMEWPQLLATGVYITIVLGLLQYKTQKRALV